MKKSARGKTECATMFYVLPRARFFRAARSDARSFLISATSCAVGARAKRAFVCGAPHRNYGERARERAVDSERAVGEASDGSTE